MAWKNARTTKKGELAIRRRAAVVEGLEEYRITADLKERLTAVWRDILRDNTYETKDEYGTLVFCLRDAGVLSLMGGFSARRSRMPRDQIERYVPIAVGRNTEQIIDVFAGKFRLNTTRVEPYGVEYDRFPGGSATIDMPPVHAKVDIGMPSDFQGGAYTIPFDGFAGLIGYARYKTEDGEEEYQTKVFPRWIPNPFWQHVSKTAEEGDAAGRRDGEG